MIHKNILFVDIDDWIVITQAAEISNYESIVFSSNCSGYAYLTSVGV
jgi:hypothetical protein